MTDQTGNAIYLILLLVLVASSVLARRLPVSQLMRMIVSWGLIFLIFFSVFAYRSEFGMIWERLKAEAGATPETRPDGNVVIPKSPDGHFYLTASVNGAPVRFLVDSGATTTALSAKAAARSSVYADRMSFPATVMTANGPIEVLRARIADFQVGPIGRKDLPVHVSDRMGETNLLGMNFLSTLSGWRIEGDRLILTP
ncbi:MAG: TIGR02281 family clan AA aspartic protease [Chakrabartia sp.]